MPYAQLELGTGNILSITMDQVNQNDYLLSDDEMGLIKSAKYGHAEYSIENGVLTHNQLMADSLNAHFGKVNTVTRLQARIALHNAGLLQNIEAIIADPLTSPVTKIAWQDAQTFERGSATLLELANTLGLTSQQIDDLFTAASQVKV